MRADKDNQAAVLEGATRVLVAARKKVLKEGLFKTHLSSFGKKLLPGMSQCVRLVKQNWPHIKMTSHRRPIQSMTKKLGQTRLIIGV